MASRPDHQSLPGTTALAGFDPIIFAFIDDLRVREGIAGKHVGRFRGTARHFLAWLGLSGIALETVRLHGRSTAQRSNVFSSTIASAVPECRHLAGSAVGPSEGHGLL